MTLWVVRAYKNELQKSGINLEMKIVTTKEGHNKIAYDRYLIGENVKFNVMPSLYFKKEDFQK